MKGLACSAGIGCRPDAGRKTRDRYRRQKPDHGQHHQGRSLVDGGVFEVTVGGNGLKDFCIDSPTAPTELMNEQRGDRAEFEIGGVEVGALWRPFHLAFRSMSGAGVRCEPF